MGQGYAALTPRLLAGPPPGSSHVKRRPERSQVQLDTGEAGRQESQRDTYTALSLCRAAGYLCVLVSGEQQQRARETAAPTTRELMG